MEYINAMVEDMDRPNEEFESAKAITARIDSLRNDIELRKTDLLYQFYEKSTKF